MSPGMMYLAFKFFPPYWGTGIRVTMIASDFKRLKVTLPLRWYNRNLRGTHFGGNLFSMTDPFYMIMLMNVLGKHYDVWDQDSHIQFCKPGKGTVFANFELSNETVANIIENTRQGRKVTPKFVIDIQDESGQIVAQVTKTIYIRQRKTRRQTLESSHDIAA